MEIEPTFCIKLDLKRKDLCEKMHNISPTYDILKILLAEGRSSSCRREQTGDRKSTRLNSSHIEESRMPSSA